MKSLCSCWSCEKRRVEEDAANLAEDLAALRATPAARWLVTLVVLLVVTAVAGVVFQ